MITESFSKLPENEKQALLYALQQGFNYMVTSEDGSFVGVNIKVTDEMEVLETQNEWTAGRFRE